MSYGSRLKEALLGISRPQKRLILAANDATLITASIWLAYFLRVGSLSSTQLYNLVPLFVFVTACGVLTLWIMRFYRNLLRELDIRALGTLGLGTILTALSLTAFAYFESSVWVPRSIPIIFLLLMFLLIAVSRVIGRQVYRWAVGLHADKQPIVVYGAGETGANTATILDNSREFSLVGFIDDDKSLHGSRIKGRRISGVSRLKELVKRHPNLRVLICIGNLTSEQRRRIIERLQIYPVQVLKIPALADIIAGRAGNNTIEEVRLQDLLGREQVPPIDEFFKEAISDKVVIVSGGGGSIGSELCMQLALNNPNKIIAIDNNEYALYHLEQNMRKALPIGFVDNRVHFLLCNILDEDALNQILAEHKPEVAYHAAAYKHVPIVENQPLKGVENNILGTHCFATCCANAGVKNFTLISTDKAVRPTNVMGASKRAAELVVQALQQKHKDTVFSMVRFGNVLGSSGSVIPLFRKQIEQGGPVTVTHPDVTRYFMTIPEAAQLVIQAGFLAKGGDVFVLDMGEPVHIQKLARLMIQLSGKTTRDADNPGGEIEIEFTGLRPGEKLYEELHLTKVVSGTIHPKILAASEASITPAEMEKHVISFRKFVKNANTKQAIALLSELVEGYKVSANLE
ncbi:MAG: nucleoside-diphosphate sugar epimerase/dehydratase [Pseudomonadota bacterium]